MDRFRSSLLTAIGRRVSEPFNLRIDVTWGGTLILHAMAIGTDGKEVALDRQTVPFFEMHIDETAADGGRTPSEAPQAKRDQHRAEVFMSVESIVNDLQRWSLPANAGGEVREGYHRAMRDVIDYLRFREEHG